MEDAIRPSAEKRKAAYEKGFLTWFDLYMRATEESSLPRSCFQIQDAMLQQFPYFLGDLDLKRGHNNLSATGTSIWEASQGSCAIPALKKHLEIPVSIASPTILTFSTDTGSSYREWFNREEDHLSVLILAWSYILSARWANLIMPGATVFTYTNVQAKCNNDDARKGDSIMVDIGEVDDDAARWWAAILAPAEGWHAFISSGQDKFRSPWSTALRETALFTTFRREARPIPTNTFSSDSAASSATALRFLSNYCTLHNVADQSLAALSAVLFLPLLHGMRKTISLPRPQLGHGEMPATSEPSVQDNYAWLQDANRLDKLLTLSCNARGMISLLSSVYYEPNVTCNAISPWLQGAFAVLDSLGDRRVLAHIMMARVPHLAFLWLGGMIMGMDKDVLQDGRFGMIPIDLHSAMWSGTMQSFLQEPISEVPAARISVTRSDECRLLYLTQGERYTRWPICPWAPFGVTPLDDTEINVRLHANCTAHSLRYAGWAWNCRDGAVAHQICNPALIPTRPRTPEVAPIASVNYDSFDLEDECVSENATRSVFGWLRVDGYPPWEKEIHQHEWVNVEDSGDDKLPEDCSEGSPVPPPSRPRVEAWIERNA